MLALQGDNFIADFVTGQGFQVKEEKEKGIQIRCVHDKRQTRGVNVMGEKGSRK